MTVSMGILCEKCPRYGSIGRKYFMHYTDNIEITERFAKNQLVIKGLNLFSFAGGSLFSFTDHETI